MNLAPFIKSSKQGHPTLDFPTLAAEFPDHSSDIWNISSPSDLIGWKHARKKHDIIKHEGIPCDLFLWAKGSPPDPRLTHVGGLPFLPKSIPWPKNHGEPMQFLCQFDFRDSLDLPGLPTLPGNILLAFITDEFSPFSDKPEDMCFIWVSAHENNIISESDIPEISEPFEFMEAWGIRHRCHDYPSAAEIAYEIEDESLSGRPYLLPVLWGTKIGGVPYESQPDPGENHSGYLCQLSSIQAASQTPWPWGNHKDPLNLDSDETSIYHESNQLLIGDLGEITFFIDQDGSVSANAACG